MAKAKPKANKSKRKPAPRKPPRAKKQARAKKQPRAIAKPTSKKTKPKGKARKAPAFELLDLHFDNVAANIPIGLERSMDTCLNMFRYELPDEYRRMQVEAKRALDGQVDQVVALAHRRGLTTLDAAAIEAMLREIAGDDAARYASADE